MSAHNSTLRARPQRIPRGTPSRLSLSGPLRFIGGSSRQILATHRCSTHCAEAEKPAPVNISFTFIPSRHVARKNGSSDSPVPFDCELPLPGVEADGGT